jgi:hypothetical protein
MMKKSKIVSLLTILFLFALTLLVSQLAIFQFVPSVKASQILEQLWVTGFTSTELAWTEVGASPYLGAIDYATNYIYTTTRLIYESRFTYADSSNTGNTINSVEVCIYAYGAGDDQIQVSVYDGSATTVIGSVTPTTTWAWYNQTCTTTLNTWTKINAGALRVESLRTGGTMSEVRVDASLLRVTSTTPNNAPTNGAGSITDMDDTNNLYAQKKLYTGSSSATDLDGYADIHYMEFRLKQGVTLRASFQYHEDDNTFNIQSGATEWDLDASSSASRVGNTITVTWKFTPHWDAVEESGLNIELYVIDTAGASDTDTVQTSYCDVVTRLVNNAGSPSTDDGRINIGGTTTITVTIRYGNNPASNTASSSYPPNAEFTNLQIHNSAHSSQVTISSITNGAGSGFFAIPSTVQNNVYHIYINMADADYTDADAVDGSTVGVIGDRIKINTGTLAFSDADGRVNVGTSATFYCTAQSEYTDNHVLGSGDSLVLSGYTFTWSVGNNRWEYTSTQGSVTTITINSLTSVNEATYGITVGNINSNNATGTWDRIKITTISLQAVDARIDVNTQGTFYCQAVLESDNHALGSGDSLILSGYAFSWSAGNSRFENSTTQGSVTSITINTFTSGNEATYGITVGVINSNTATIIWDRIYDVVPLGSDDTRINVGATATITVTLHYDFDETDVTDGTVTINGVSATHLGSGQWRIQPNGGGVVTGITYNTVACSGNAYGITSVSISSSVTQVWDRIKIDGFGRTDADGRVNVNSAGVFWATASLEYIVGGNHTLGLGDSLTLSGYIFTWNVGNSRFENSTIQASVTSITINSFTSGNEATFSITVGNINSETSTIIWDRLQVQNYTVADTRVNVNDNVNIDVLIWFDFDNTICTTATITINGFSATHQGSGVYRITRTSASVTSVTYNTVACSVETNEITTVDQNSQSIQVIWDKARIYYEVLDDSRVNINTNIEFRVKGLLLFDNHALTSGDTITANFGALNWDAVNSWFDGSKSQATVSDYIFSVTSLSEATYTITSFEINVTNPLGVWDSLQVQSYTVVDDRVNVNDNVDIDVLIWFDYDDVPCTTATITINGFSASHQGSGVYRITRTSAVVTNVTYNTVACSAESTYDITTVDQNSQSTTVIWDRIKVYWEQLNDSRVDIGSAIEGRYKAVLDYDDHPLGSNDSMSVSWGSLTWDSENGWWDILHSESVVTGITITGWSGNEVTYGITSITENITETTYIYDRIEIYEKDDPLIVNEIWQTQNLDQQVIPTYVLFYPLLVYAVLLFPAIKNKKKAKAFTFILLLSFLVVIVPNISINTVFASDETVTVNTYVIIWFRARYDYDKITYGDSSGSTLSINATSATYNSTAGALYWYRNVTQSTPGEYVYTVTAISDGVYGLTTFNNIIGYITITFTDPPPTYSNVGTNSTLAGQPCEFYTLWNDNTNVSGFIFGTNNTGSWTNDTWVAFSAFYNSTAAWSNVTKTLNSTIDVVIQWQIWCNDTGNNWNNTGIQTFATTLAYKLNLRVMDWDLTDAIANAYVTMNNETDHVQVSDSNGWANYTGLSGIVTVKVQYFGFWVNGTFSVTMDSDKTIDVRCKLYDVTVLVQEGVQNAYLAGANVTVYNSTIVQGNKITSGVTGNNGQVQLLNLPNNTLTFTQYGGASYSLVIGNTTQLVSSENQTITLTADQNNVNTNNNYSIIAFAGMTIPFKSSFVTKRLKKKMQKRSETNEGSPEEVLS